MTLVNINIDEIYAYVKTSCFYGGDINLETRSLKLTELDCVVFGATSIPNKALLFNTIDSQGKVWARVSPKYIKLHKDAIDIPIEELVFWNSYSEKISWTVYDYLKGKRVKINSKLNNIYYGTYLGTFDFYDNSSSECPWEHKTFNLIAADKKENSDEIIGSLFIYPNNRLLFADPTLVTVPLESPDFIPNQEYDSVEDFNWRLKKESINTFFYQID